MIELSGITVAFDEKVVLNNVCAKWPDEGAIALRGASGAGKTTLLRVLAGLQTLNTGTIVGMEGRAVSAVFQEDRLLPWRSALENVALVSNESVARELLIRLDLADALSLRPSALSGGMRRRVAIARAVAFSGDVLLLDEPFTGLDDAHREQAATLLRERARLIIVATHDDIDASLLGVSVSLTL